MARSAKYTDIEGRELSLEKLDGPERKLVQTLMRRATSHPDWSDFDNFWMRAVADFYDARGVSRKKSAKTVVFQIAQDLSSRLGIAAGLVRLSDYRDELEDLIRTRFKTQREFCKATKLSEDMVSHVLAGRKHLAIDTLSQALKRIGYSVHIAPEPPIAEAQNGNRAAG